MKKGNNLLRNIWSLLGAVWLAILLGMGLNAPLLADSLYIGDRADNSVKQYNATTGAFQRVFIPAGNQGLLGPSGMIFTKGLLFLANQNVFQPFSGEILRYNPTTGAFISALVPCKPPLRACNANAPFAPRGMIRGPGYTVYVADSKNSPTSGRIAQYNLNNGALVRNLDKTGYTGPFFPKGIVRGPDDLLYVTGTGDPDVPGLTDPGFILRFSAQTGRFVDVFSSNTAVGCAGLLHSPEGLTFGPDGRLYVTTANYENLSATGKILVFNRATKACAESIELGIAGASRGIAPSIVFGPGNLLFIPDVDTGQVRKYNVATKVFSNFIPAGGQLINPWYMSFGLTDPESLEYLN